MVEIKGVYSHFEGKLERLTQRLETLENNLEVERNCSRELCEIHERQLNQVVQDVIASFREVEALEERLTTEVARMDNVSSGFYRLIERMDGLENRATNEAARFNTHKKEFETLKESIANEHVEQRTTIQDIRESMRRVETRVSSRVKDALEKYVTNELETQLETRLEGVLYGYRLIGFKSIKQNSTRGCSGFNITIPIFESLTNVNKHCTASYDFTIGSHNIIFLEAIALFGEIDLGCFYSSTVYYENKILYDGKGCYNPQQGIHQVKEWICNSPCIKTISDFCESNDIAIKCYGLDHFDGTPIKTLLEKNDPK